jgi:3-oxoadipate enol-lactonase
MRRLRIRDKLLRVRDEPEPSPDPGKGPAPLFCIHGAGMSSVSWMELVKRLPPARRVVALDLPGHGQSERWPEQPSIAGYRDAVEAVCSELKLQRIVLVGHSMGGAVALAYALAWPEKVAGLVLVNSAARLKVADASLAMLEQVLPSEASSQTGQVWVDRMPPELAEVCFSPATSSDLRQRWQAMLMSAERQVILGDFLACRSFDVRDQLAKLRTPTLILGGSDDLLVPPKILADTAQRIAGAQLQLLEDTGHLSHIEQPEQFFQKLTAFLQTLH